MGQARGWHIPPTPLRGNAAMGGAAYCMAGGQFMWNKIHVNAAPVAPPPDAGEIRGGISPALAGDWRH